MLERKCIKQDTLHYLTVGEYYRIIASHQGLYQVSGRGYPIDGWYPMDCFGVVNQKKENHHECV